MEHKKKHKNESYNNFKDRRRKSNKKRRIRERNKARSIR